MAMPRKRPFANEKQYYTYAWFYFGDCIYAGYGHAGRCRNVSYKLAPLLRISHKKLIAEATIVVLSCASRKAAQAQERIWIELLSPKYCIAPGCGSWPGFLSIKARARIAAAVSNRKWTSEQRKAASLRMLGNKRLLGYKHSEETKQKISEAGKGHAVSQLTREKAAERCRIRNVQNPPSKGVVRSPEYKQKLRELALRRYRGNQSS